VIFVDKKDGGRRMCGDYENLNNFTIKNKYAWPRIQDLFDKSRELEYFPRLMSGQDTTKLRSRRKKFRRQPLCPGNHEYLVVPFGLMNAPTIFMNLMNKIFMPYMDKFVIVFIDDILIYSKNKEEHVKHLRIAL
jgi:hypothetical protein